MLIGYARVSKADRNQKHDMQIDALVNAGVDKEKIYLDKISGSKKDRPGLDAMLKSLRSGDTVVVYALDRLGRNLRHLINLINDLTTKGIWLKVLTGQGAIIDTTTAHGKLLFAVFGALAEFELELTRERIRAGIKAARARGRNGGRRFKLTKSQVRQIQASMGKKETVVSDLARELNVTTATIYSYVSPKGELRPAGEKVLSR